MSHMEITKAEDERMSESRALLYRAFNVAMGSYIEQEAKKKDVWRDQTWGQIYGHMKHEFGEMSKSKQRTTQLHNGLDLLSLAAMLVSKILEAEVDG